MLIRYGYEITVTCAQPTAMVCLLSVSEDRKADIRVAEKVFTTPIIPTTTYLDSFGNRCRRLVAPAGDLTIWGDATIEDDGKIDPADFGAARSSRRRPARRLPALSHGQPLLRDRQAEPDGLGPVRQLPPGWGRVQAVCDFVHQHIKFDYMQARSTRTAFEAFNERIGVCRDFAHLAVDVLPMPQHSGALRQRPSRRHRRAGRRSDGFQRLDRGVSSTGSWWTFDPRNNMPRIGRIVVARGRDAADIPLINSFGPHVLKSFRVWTYEVTEQQMMAPGA